MDFGGFVADLPYTPNFFLIDYLIIYLFIYFTCSGKVSIVKLLKKNKQVQQVAKMFGEVKSLQDDFGTSIKDLTVIRLVT